DYGWTSLSRRVLGWMGDTDHCDVVVLGPSRERFEDSPHVGNAVAVDLTAHVGRNGIDDHEHDATQFLDLAAESGQVLLQAKGRHTAVLEHSSFQSMDASEVCACSLKARADGILRRVLRCQDEDATGRSNAAVGEAVA